MAFRPFKYRDEVIAYVREGAGIEGAAERYGLPVPEVREWVEVSNRRAVLSRRGIVKTHAVLRERRERVLAVEEIPKPDEIRMELTRMLLRQVRAKLPASVQQKAAAMLISLLGLEKTSKTAQVQRDIQEVMERLKGEPDTVEAEKATEPQEKG